MKPYWVKTGWLIKKIFSGYVWDIPAAQKTVYLTFDDGPIPQVTEWVLDLLKQHSIKVTFFCIGNNIDKNPEVFQKVIKEGHTIGNHTYNHINGWNTDTAAYLKNMETCRQSIIDKSGIDTKLFRPPYGKISREQAKEVKNLGYQIIMWDVLSADFDTTITPQKCLDNVIKNAANGSVIIFHDSIKAFPNLEYALPKVIEYLKEKGFSFGTLS
ncbi:MULTISPECIES: polysaccharide deacetylase family protein [Flavobacterium]|uniref:Polysaccharide deacetylase family protein n=1 Tax=Flavobacterium suzhouense TaxID=1529638 RepID=A0ABW5NUL4_9FLAO|nr:polysaccharide deacetylase family protein [Flavobacterium sp. AG291]RDI15807.1 peptidoglycan/xylan/chitin deacetylase (PgdA/CDA1 family) [Flavobacterium sp. AG291]